MFDCVGLNCVAFKCISLNRFITVQLKNVLTFLGTEIFSGIYSFQLHYNLALQHHYIITILFQYNNTVACNTNNRL